MSEMTFSFAIPQYKCEKCGFEVIDIHSLFMRKYCPKCLEEFLDKNVGILRINKDE